MKTKLIITAIALFAAMPALAEFTLVTKGDEIALSDLRLPRNDGGTIAYKPCRTCEIKTAIVNSDVAWIINGKRIGLDKFRERAEEVSNPDKRAVTVTRHIESNRITKVSLTVRDSDQG